MIWLGAAIRIFAGMVAVAAIITGVISLRAHDYPTAVIALIVMMPFSIYGIICDRRQNARREADWSKVPHQPLELGQAPLTEKARPKRLQ